VKRIEAKRILVMRLGAIGDALRVLPALQRLRRSLPAAHIGWGIEHWVHPVVVGHPAVDVFHVLDRRALSAGPRAALKELRRFVTEARAQGYDAILDFHGRLKSGVLVRAIGAPHRIGFAAGDSTEMNHLFTNVHVGLADRWENRVHRFLHLLEPLGLDTSYDAADVGIHLDPTMRTSASRWYQSSGSPRVACYPGSSAGRVRERWPENKWVELLGELARREISTVVFWGPSEKELAERIVAAAGRQCRLAPATSLPEMMAQIACVDAFIGSDTAAMHMAWMQGVPTAAFVGPKPPRTVAPLAPTPSRILRAGEYYIEGRRGSRQAEEVVTAVPVREALEAVIELLAEEPTSSAGEAVTDGA
jgi:ADP-heptose:LPS heptosyltransferase